MYYLIQWQEKFHVRFNLHFKGYLKRLNLYMQKRKQRRELLNLSDHLLDDIGITRDQAIEEATK